MTKKTSKKMEIAPGVVRTVSFIEGSGRGRWQATVDGRNHAVHGEILPGDKFKPDAKYQEVVDAYMRKHGIELPVTVTPEVTPTVEVVEEPKAPAEAPDTFFGKVKSVVNYAKSVFGRGTPGSATDTIDRPVVAKPAPVTAPRQGLQKPVRKIEKKPIDGFQFQFVGETKTTTTTVGKPGQRPANALLQEANKNFDGHYVMVDGSRRVVRIRSLATGEVNFQFKSVTYIGVISNGYLKISRIIRGRAAGRPVYRVGTMVKINKD